MTDQPGLWDQAYARKSDPETSHEAAASWSSANLTDARRHVLRMFQHGPAHDYELIERSQFWGWNYSRSGIQTRRNELCKMGLVEWTGDFHTLPSGRRARVWAITDAGRQALA